MIPRLGNRVVWGGCDGSGGVGGDLPVEGGSSEKDSSDTVEPSDGSGVEGAGGAVEVPQAVLFRSNLMRQPKRPSHHCGQFLLERRYYGGPPRQIDRTGSLLFL